MSGIEQDTGTASAGIPFPEEHLGALVATSPLIGPILERWRDLALPDGWLSGSALAQTVWNSLFAFPPHHGLADLDLVYFDAAHLSAESEARHGQRIRALFPDIPLWIDVKNQARVHLWYEAKFGYAIAPYRSIEQAIATFPTTAASVAIRPDETGLSILAPFGLSDILTGTVRPNKRQIPQSLYETKVARWRRFWPDLAVVEWQEAN